MTEENDAVSIWINSDYPWYYTKDRLRQGVIRDSVENFVRYRLFNRESGPRLVPNRINQRNNV